MTVILDRLTALASLARSNVGSPPTTTSWWRSGPSMRAADTHEIMIYGEIGSDWGPDDLSAASFVRALAQVTASNIVLRINSPGGAIFDGIAIHSALARHPARVTAHVDGIAASAASFVAQAADDIVMATPAKMMIHDASGLAIGGAEDMRAMADLLDELSDTIAGIYAARSGRPVARWRTAMRAATWYSSASAVADGLADRVADPPAGDQAPRDRASQLIRARARATSGRTSNAS